MPTLRRTVERAALSRCLSQLMVLCPASQRDRCAALLAGTTAVVRPYDPIVAPWQALAQTARKWSLDGWRGGLGGTTHFDEFTHPHLLAAMLDSEAADAVLSLPPAAPLLDPGLLDAMIGHREAKGDEIRLVFAQVPPGLAGLLLDASLIRELAEKNIPIGWVFSYKPDAPQKDLLFQPCCLPVPVELRHASGRLTCDTRRATERVQAFLRRHPVPSLAAIGEWLANRAANAIEPLPVEVEIELTTDDPYPNTLLRPRGSRVPPRGPIDPGIVARILRELGEYDDSLVVLGGFGDPLRHPDFAGILQMIASARAADGGPFGLAVRTSAIDLDEPKMEALMTGGVDVLEVTIDAWTSGLYASLHSPHDRSADLATVLQRIDRLEELRRLRRTVKPIVVPSFTKCVENLHELDEFHDGWLRKAGVVSIVGYSRFGGRLADRAAMPMAPAPRAPCVRLRSRTLVLADGRMVPCDQDFAGDSAVGSVRDSPLGDVWSRRPLERLRDDHRLGRFEVNPLCAACDEWHRP